MTHDELVRFAAEKVGITLKEWNGRLLKPNESKSWIVVDGGQYEIFDLTSPDLFLKGLWVCPYEVNVFKASEVSKLPDSIEIWDSMYDKQAIRDLDNLPLKFWQCWAEVEGRENDGN